MEAAGIGIRHHIGYTIIFGKASLYKKKLNP